MAYRKDSDLEFLAKCSDRDLDDLVNLLIYDNDGKKDGLKSYLTIDNIRNLHQDIAYIGEKLLLKFNVMVEIP